MSLSHSFGKETNGTLWKALLLLCPGMLLLLAAMRVPWHSAVLLLVGVGVQVVIAVGVIAFFRSWLSAFAPLVLLLALTTLCFLWFSVPESAADWSVHLGQAVSVLLILAIISNYVLHQSGAWTIRRAHRLVRDLAERKTWPEPLNVCRELPEVAELRSVLAFDASPALALLESARPEVRLCALAALEFRKHWRPGQAEAVLAVLRNEPVPEVRAAAILALANCNDRLLLESLADYLRDPDARVRAAAADALFWSSDKPWTWVRFGVRKALSDPALRNDSSLLREGQTLSQDAVNDLTAWAAEKGILGLRSSQVLALHYTTLLQENPDEALPTLHKIVVDPHAAPLLRIELGKLLLSADALDHAAKEELLDPANPAPLRLLAAEKLLETGPNVRAIVCLRELARLPNREMALTTAGVVQKCLHVDLGLALGQPLPALNSPRAIEVTRRLMAWASQPDAGDNVLDAAYPVGYSRM
ncbi:MAG: HEAT repeat domain-containing protein [Gemmatales bacterium]|nr:HEAT repeat domain-containing protein [Gemmatales bacterium]MDW8388249.1 HEAT repeat domain-containing protein [Gemmatales bacterium]